MSLIHYRQHFPPYQPRAPRNRLRARQPYRRYLTKHQIHLKHPNLHLLRRVMTREPSLYQLRQQQVPLQQQQATLPQLKQARKQDLQGGAPPVRQRNDGNQKLCLHRNLHQRVHYLRRNRRQLHLQCPCIAFLRNVNQIPQLGKGIIRTDLLNLNNFILENRPEI